MNYKPIDKVKVTVEWNANPDGSSLAPMTVQFTADANPNEIIEAVGKAMGMIKEPEKPKCEKDDFIHIESRRGRVVVTYSNGKERSFLTYRMALDWIANNYAHSVEVI